MTSSLLNLRIKRNNLKHSAWSLAMESNCHFVSENLSASFKVTSFIAWIYKTLKNIFSSVRVLLCIPGWPGTHNATPSASRDWDFRHLSPQPVEK
jgi:hypothetical protein